MIFYHTKYHAINTEFLPVAAVLLQKKHMPCAAQEEEQKKDGIDRDIWDDGGHLSQCL